MKKLLILTAFAALIINSATAQTTVSAKNAAKHIGQTVKICDKVFSGKLIKTSGSILLNIAGDDPNQALTVMIPSAAMGKFKGKPQTDYIGKDVIITGKLITWKGKPQVIITDPKQLKIVMVDNMKNPPLKKPN